MFAAVCLRRLVPNPNKVPFSSVEPALFPACANGFGAATRVSSEPMMHGPGLPCQIPASSRFFGIKRVKQRRRSRGRIIQLKQTHYEPKPEGYTPLPLSLMGSGYVRRVLKAGTVDANAMAEQVSWDRYKSDVRGVRWHQAGAWRVQFDRRNYEHNFFVKCSCYFRVQIYGFDRAKELAIAYRRRLEAEWEEQQAIFEKLDIAREQGRLKRKQDKALAYKAAQYEAETGESLFGDGGMPPPVDYSTSQIAEPV